MPVYARAFIEPAVAKAGVHAHHQIVLAAVIQKVAHVEAKGRVPVIVAPNEISVQKHQRAAKSAVKLHRDAPSAVFFRNVEGAPVPAHAGLRIPSPQRLVAVRFLFVIAHKRQLNRPVVRQIERAPFRVVKFLCGKPEFSRLGEVSLAYPKSQVAQRVVRVALKKLPAKVEQQMLPRSHRSQRLSRRSAGIPREQSVRAPHRPCDQS